jgi:hypothetical protein
MLSRVDRLIETAWPAGVVCDCTSLSVVPDRYETNAGIIGRMQGEKKDPAPASAETKMFVSTNVDEKSAQFCINTFFQICSRLTTHD